jgi:hypothetical protein
MLLGQSLSLHKGISDTTRSEDFRNPRHRAETVPSVFEPMTNLPAASGKDGGAAPTLQLNFNKNGWTARATDNYQDDACNVWRRASSASRDESE